MHPIQPINDGAAAPRIFNTRPADSVGTGAGAAIGSTTGSAATDLQRMTNVVSQVQNLMGEMGGGSITDQNLRMIIALMILMAILDALSQNDQTASPQGASQGPGAGLGQGGSLLYFEQSYSYTSISIEQTTVTTSAIIAPDAGAFFGDGAQPFGEQLDVSA